MSKRASKITGKPIAKVLIAKATSNANKARLVSRSSPGDISDDAFAFDVQQAIEKYLKAAIAWNGYQYPYTHDLADLIDFLDAKGIEPPDVNIYDLEKLTPFAESDRYESTSTVKLNRDALVDLMERVEEWVLEVMK